MKLSNAQAILDRFADTVIETGGNPDTADVEVYSQDGQVQRVKVEWTVPDGTTYSADWRNK